MNTAAATAAAKPGRTTRRATPGGKVAGTADDPCAGLDGQPLDDCLGYEAPGGRDVDGPASRDFAAEQQRRDQELLERDSDEAANAADDARADEPPVDENMPDEDRPDEDMPDEDMPPPDDYGDEPPPDDLRRY